MSRQFRTRAESQTSIEMSPFEAPAIDWGLIGKSASAPKPLNKGLKGDGSLPSANLVVLSWTDAEWSALDHVFVNSSKARGPNDSGWHDGWKTYTKGASAYHSDGEGGTLWGSFCVVGIADPTGAEQTVLLFKSNAHLAHAPWIGGLRAMIENVLADTGATCVYSLGTAGAAKTTQKLGDAVVTNAAFLEATLPENKGDSANGQTFSSTWFPPQTLATQAQQLMLKLSEVATTADLTQLFGKVSALQSTGLRAANLINAALSNLDAPKIWAMQGVPLNTSDDYGMAPGNGSDPYSVYEEDDAVIAQVAKQKGIKYSSIRNVSDTVIPGTAGNITLTDSQREAWAGALYDRYQFQTAVNGAIAGWAIIAGETA